MSPGTDRPPAPGSLVAPITVERGANADSGAAGDEPGFAAMRAAADELAELAGLAAYAAASGGRVELRRVRLSGEGRGSPRWLASAEVSAVGRASARVELTLYATSEDGAPERCGSGSAALVITGPTGRPVAWPPELRASCAAWRADAG